MGTSAVTVLVLVTVIVAVDLMVVVLLLRTLLRFTWNALAMAHPEVEPAPDAVRRNFQSFRVGALNLGGCVHVAVDDAYLHLRPAAILRRLGARSISVPWDAVEALAEEGAARAVEIEDASRLPADLVEQVHAGGFLRMPLPAGLGGWDATPAECFRASARIATGDGSLGWQVASAAYFNGILAAAAPVALRDAFFADRRSLLAGSAAGAADGPDDLASELKTIESVRLVGRHQIPARVIWKALKTRRPGMWPWSDRPALRLDFLRADVEAIAFVYRQYGFLDTRADYRVASTRDPRRITVIFEIEEGRRSHISAVDFAGVESYPENDLRRHLLARPGRPFNPGYLVADTARISRLYQDRGFIPHVTADARRESLDVNVRYEVHEGPAYRFGEVYLTSPGASRTLPGPSEGAGPKGSRRTISRVPSSSRTSTRISVAIDATPSSTGARSAASRPAATTSS